MKADKQSVLVKLGGKTGEGIDSTGEILAYILKDSNLFVNTFRSFPSVIKGGNTNYEVHVGNYPLYARGDWVDILVAFDQESLDQLHPEIAAEGLIIYDSDLASTALAGDQVLGIPLSSIAKDLGNKLMRNMVALGVISQLLDLELSTAERVIEAKFKSKGEKVVQQNIEACTTGYHYQDVRLKSYALKAEAGSPKLFLSGNEAMAFGALAAECKLFAGYPITPATDIMEWLALRLPAYEGTVIQTEDEIAALCTVIGANYAGVRAMTATSGPGLSLMTEAFGLAGMSETPCVIVNVQRPGPSAGMPTKHEQSDIKHMVHAAHGEIPRIVIAPGTVQECFEDIVSAFNLADRYQCPVIVASDQDLALRKQTVDAQEINVDRVVIDRGEFADTSEGFKRYAYTESGISPRALPGQEGFLFLASGDEHDDTGKIDVELPAVRKKIMDKRMSKLKQVDFAGTKLYGALDSKRIVVGVGSTTSPILEVLNRIPDLAYLQIRRLFPFPTAEVARVLNAAEWIAVVEHNSMGQLAHLLKAEIPIHDRLHQILKYDGMPFKPIELMEEIEACLPTKTL